MRHVEKMLDRMPSSRRAVHVAVTILCIVVLGLIGVLFWQVHKNADALADSSAIGRSRGQALGTANAKLQQNGIPTVKVSPDKPTPGNTDVGPTTPSSTPKFERGSKGDQGDTGPGPSKAQVVNAVTSYCDAHSDCAGKPSQAQVAAAVLTYCKGDNCVGPAGADGTDATGKPGATGEPGQDATGEPGPQGPGPTAEQVAAAVNVFCADGACRGPKGDTVTGPPGPAGKDATGAPGRDGKDAPKIDGGTCTGTTLTFHETDGSTFDVKDACGTSTVTTTVTAPPPTDPPTSPDPTSTAP